MGCTSPSPKTRPILGQEHEIENSNRLPSQGGVSATSGGALAPSTASNLPELSQLVRWEASCNINALFIF